MAKEDGAPSVGPYTFSAWAAQGTEDAERIWAIYDFFVAVDETNIGELLLEATTKDEGEKVTFCVCVETRGRLPVLQTVLLHGLVLIPCFAANKDEVPV